MVVQLLSAGPCAGCRSFSAPSVEPYGGSSEHLEADGFPKSFSAPSVEPYGGSLHIESRILPDPVSFQCSLCRAVWWFTSGRRGSGVVVAFSAPSVEPYGGSAGILVVFYVINDLKALYEASQGRLRPLFCWNQAIRQLLERQFSQYGNCGKSLPVCEGCFLSFFSGHAAVAR